MFISKHEVTTAGLRMYEYVVMMGISAGRLCHPYCISFDKRPNDQGSLLSTS